MPRDAPLPYNDSPPRGGARGRGGRDRSRSPVRDSRRYDDRGDRDYGRDRPRHDDRGDRADRGDRDYGHADRERRYERGGYDRGRGGYSRDTRDSRDSRDRDWDRGDRGDRYGGRGGRAGRDRSRSRERPLDRRAIEEGRRRREEERARGVVYTDDGRKIEPEAPPAEEEEEEAEPAEEMDEETAAMAAMMGFGGFGTTKGAEVEGNDVGMAKVNKKRTWRQYMNRRGGFNRPLDKIK